MGTCKVCGGAIFASNEVAGYSGPICGNPMHMQYPPTYVLPPNDNTELLKRIVNLENTVAGLLVKVNSEAKKGGDDE